MRVERLDVFDFKITLNEQEFIIVRQAADDTHMSIAGVVKRLLENQIELFKACSKLKE